MYNSTNLVHTDLNVGTFNLLYERQTLLYMYKIKNNINIYQPLHYYHTRLKNNNNINIPNSYFGNQSPIIKDVFLLRKYNINIYSLINFNQYKNYMLRYFYSYIIVLLIFNIYSLL